MFEFLMSPIVQIIAFVVFGAACYSMGWYASNAKCKRDKHREDLRIAIVDTINGGAGFMKDGKRIDPKDVYLEDVFDEWDNHG